ncbi:DEAD/DEAH box helicase [Halomicronema sp. CCY15110]|uniref:DEAD/DEAH box helicase n=1 Tax=Halomicronema sp. CCY15110 TaxID=2767773 RepID=UPI00195111F2|nr:DEAD/DEAH box helicase [Halomicronema sp. CCY15110]
MAAPSQSPRLRPYQVELINDLYRQINEGHTKIAIIAGTGAGKTVISGQICAHAEAAGKRLMFLVHLDVLVGQTYEKMKSFGLHCGFIKAGWEEDREAPIQIASVQTMAQRKWWRQWPADVIFYDEAHTTLFSRVGKSVLYKTHPNAVHLAMTATPERLGKDQLGEHLDTLVSAPPPYELQAMGFLSQMKYFSMPPDGVADLKEVKTVRGDYDKAGLKNACDRPELVSKIVQEWQRLVSGKRTIAFCVDIEHARHVAEAFRQAGIPADTVEGGTPIKDRQRMYADLREERILVLTSCNVISIGFDEPSVEVGLMLRPTQSSALHIQQIGRVMRISPQTGKACGIILDQAGNLERLGFPEDIDEYRLPMCKDGSGGGSPPPMKACPQCGRMVLSFVVRCPECEHQWLSDRPLNLEDMVQIYSREQAHAIRDIPTLIEIFHGYRRLNFTRGYAPTLTEHHFLEKTGRTAKDAWCLGSIFGRQPTWEQKKTFLSYLHRSAKKLGKPGDWIVREFEKEFGAGTWDAMARMMPQQQGDRR